MEIVNTVLENSNNPTDPQKSTDVQKDIELDIDVGLLVASDYNALNIESLRKQPNKYLKLLTRDNVQLLINKIWEIPTKRVDEVVVAELPEPKYVLPRARKNPKPKPLTKWQQFAKAKGIKSNKKNKSKFKWDEELQKWIPKYGYKRAKAEEQKQWLIEVGDNNDLKEDLFTAMKANKRDKQAKNELQRLRNIAKAKNIKLPRVGLLTNEHFSGADQLATAVTVARKSTASLGKFQDKLPKEKEAKSTLTKVACVKRRSKEAPVSLVDEKQRNKELAEKILRSKKNILNADFSTPVLAKKKATGKKSKTSRKPKTGKGKKDVRKKKGGTKRR